MLCNKEFDKCQVKGHSFHQHPHEVDQVKVMEDHSYGLTVRWNASNWSRPIYTSQESDLRYGQGNAEVDVNVVPYDEYGPVCHIIYSEMNIIEEVT